MGTALEAFRAYTRAFSALDARSAASHFAEPAILVTPRGVNALPDRAAVERAYAAIMAELPAQGYERTDFTDLRERRLTENLVEVSGKGSWIRKDGSPFMPFGLTYTLRRADDVWRIVVALVHEP